MCPPPQIDEELSTLGENDATCLDETMTGDQRYEGLLKLIDNLKDQLIKEKQEKITLEKEVRSELCAEFNKMMVEIEENWEKRLQDQKERSEELLEWKMAKEQEMQRKKRKRANDDNSEATIFFEKAELETMLEDKEHELKCLQEKVDAMMSTHNLMTEEKKKLQEELTKKVFELEKSKEMVSESKLKVQEVEEALQVANEVKLASVKSESAEPIIEDLKKQISNLEAEKISLIEDKTNLKELLDEAGEDFVQKENELKKTLNVVKDQEQQMMQQSMTLTEMKEQLEESRSLLTDSAKRMEEKEEMVNHFEELVEELRAKVVDLEKELKEVKGRKIQVQDGVCEKDKEIEDLKAKLEQVKHNRFFYVN